MVSSLDDLGSDSGLEPLLIARGLWSPKNDQTRDSRWHVAMLVAIYS